MADRLIAARIVGTFGVAGELKCQSTRVGEASFTAGRTFALGSEDGARHVTIARVRPHKGQLLVTFEGISSADAAEPLVGRALYLEREAVELAENEYLDADLIGMRLVDGVGNELGVVAGVEHYPAQDCLIVGRARALVPMVREFVRSIDIVARTIEVALPPGLLDPGAADEA